MNFDRFLVFVCFCILSVTCKNEIYRGNKVYKITLETQHQHDNWGKLKSDSVDFWRNPSLKHNIDGLAMVSHDDSEEFESRLTELDIDVQVYIEDVYEFLQQNDVETSRFNAVANRNFSYDGFHRYEDILLHIYNLSAANPDLIEITEHGYTEGNHELISLYVSDSSISSSTKPIIMVEAGINPRDWITVPSALNVLENVLAERSYLDSFDWIIVPVANPDGYEYTHTDQRLWTKSRSTNSYLGFICPGVNIDRNFDIGWLTADSSSSPCSNLYTGAEPNSEIETRFLISILNSYSDRIKAYISLQNNGGVVTFPWRYERAASGMFRQHFNLGNVIVSALNGRYVLDVGSESIADRVSGTSADYAQKNGVLYSIVLDVLQGDNGVLIEDDLISQLIDDVWTVVRIVADDLV